MTRLDTRTVSSRKARKALDETDLPLLRSALGSRVAYQEMPSSGVGVTRYQPKSKAAGEVRALLNELESLEAAR